MTQIFPTEHSYYQNEGCHFSNDCHQDFDSFDDFLSEWGDFDIDLNRVIRYDWEKEEDGDAPTLKIYFMIQRKAYPFSCYIKADPEKDQERVYQYLKPHWEYTKTLWFEFNRPTEAQRGSE